MNKKAKISRFIIITLISLALPVSIFLIGKRTYFSNRAYTGLFGWKANLTINLTDSTQSNSYPWANLAQGGEERSNMLSSVWDKVSLLEPSYIRIDHVFDFYDVIDRDSSGKLVYNWTKLDEAISTISLTGAKPFICLSYMPKSISSGSEVDIPLDWNEWKEVVRRTVEHISGLRGLAIPDVYYEVWNEPDLYGEFRLSGRKNYLSLYKFAHDGALEAKDVLNFKLGGPATTTFSKIWFKNFLDFAKENKLRVDFYSWHRYSSNILDFDKDIMEAKTLILDYPEYSNVEFVISESGFSSKIDSGYDGNFSAIHALSMYALTFTKIPKVFTFEIKDGHGGQKFWGRWGILTHERFGEPEAKPRYKAIEFLNKMKGNWYPVFGQGSWVRAIATTDGEVIRVLIVNYDPFRRHFENVPINFVNLPSKKFKFRRINFLGDVSENLVEISETNWTTLQMFEPNSSAILEIVPKYD